MCYFGTNAATKRKKMEVTPSTSKTPDPRGGGKKKLGAGGRGGTLEEVRIERQEEGIAEDEEVYDNQEVHQETQPQGKPKKDKKGKKVAEPEKEKNDDDRRITGLHIPDEDDVITPRSDGLPHGLPDDGGNVLIGYADSWAKRIYETPDHNRAVRVLRHQRAAEWSLDEEVPEVIAYVQASALWPAINYEHKEYDSVSASAFTERFFPETYTFQLPFGEMSITPDEASKITGLKARGVSVDAGFYDMNWDDLYNLYLECLGWGSMKTELEFCRSVKDVDTVFIPGGRNKKNKKIKLTNLKREFENTKERVTQGLLIMDPSK